MLQNKELHPWVLTQPGQHLFDRRAVRRRMKCSARLKGIGPKTDAATRPNVWRQTLNGIVSSGQVFSFSVDSGTARLARLAESSEFRFPVSFQVERA
jgi:hypothetical protein